MEQEQVEKQLIQIVATDRIYRPISSIDGKLKRKREKLANSVDLSEFDNDFQGERVYARIEDNEVQKARGMRDAVEMFKENHPREGKILEGYIQETRKVRERHLVFDTYAGKRISAEDYMKVMTDMGFTEPTARNFYPELMDVSRKIARSREDGERSLMLTQSYDSRKNSEEKEE